MGDWYNDAGKHGIRSGGVWVEPPGLCLAEIRCFVQKLRQGEQLLSQPEPAARHRLVTDVERNLDRRDGTASHVVPGTFRSPIRFVPDDETLTRDGSRQLAVGETATNFDACGFKGTLNDLGELTFWIGRHSFTLTAVAAQSIVRSVRLLGRGVRRWFAMAG